MAWLIAVVAVMAGAIVVSVRAPSLRLDDHANTAVLRFFARARTPWLTGIANGILVAGSGRGGRAVGGRTNDRPRPRARRVSSPHLHLLAARPTWMGLPADPAKARLDMTPGLAMRRP
jgi:hypothetical protein